MSQQHEAEPGGRPDLADDEPRADRPADVDPEAVADAPEEQVEDADRPIDDEEFRYPGETDEQVEGEDGEHR